VVRGVVVVLLLRDGDGDDDRGHGHDCMKNDLHEHEFYLILNLLEAQVLE